MGTYFSDFLDLDFVGKSKSTTRSSDSDVIITKVKSGYSITFRNKVWEKIGERIMIAVKGNYMFFKGDDEGWKISIKKDANPGNISVVHSNAPAGIENLVGEYKLKFMEPINMYYIHKEEEE